MADAAAQALLEVMQDNCSAWEASSWRASYARAVSYLFELPTPSEETASASETAAVSQQCVMCTPPPHSKDSCDALFVKLAFALGFTRLLRQPQ